MKKNILYLLALCLIGALAYYLTSSNGGSGSIGKKALSDFAIKDTASIGRITIDDGQAVVDLKRKDDGFWSLNDEHIAMPHHVDLLLKTFYAAGVQAPVPASMKNNVMKIIAGDIREVKVFDKEGTWIKTWHVGRSTQSNQGTYALLETPEEGLSDEPYIIEYRGFRGYLTSRFHAMFDEWRWTGLFYNPALKIKAIEIQTPRAPEAGFRIELTPGESGEVVFKDYQGKAREVNKVQLAQYIENYRAINVEHFKIELEEAQVDSLLSITPSFIVKVMKTNDEMQEAKFYYRKTPIGLVNRMGDRAPEIDPERLYVYFDGTLAMGQRLTFDKILRTSADF